MPVKNKKSIENDAIKNETDLSVNWSLNDRVLCRNPNSEIYYEAKIINITNKDNVKLFTVHYQVCYFYIFNLNHLKRVGIRDTMKKLLKLKLLNVLNHIQMKMQKKLEYQIYFILL